LLRRHAVAFAALFLLLGSAAYAAADQVTTRAAPKKIYACAAGDHPTLNLTTAKRTCPRGQHKISWNAAGRPGTRGPVGSTGTTAARGVAGTRLELGQLGAAADQPGARDARRHPPCRRALTPTRLDGQTGG
jgi:hypothetical protein